MAQTYTVYQSCNQYIDHPTGCKGKHSIIVVDANNVILHPRNPPCDGGVLVLTRLVVAVTPKRAADKFRVWQRTGLPESYLTEANGRQVVAP